MGHAICVSSIKGGCGKTTTAVNLSTALAIAEKKVLLVDCDPQGHATSSMGIDKAALKSGLYEVLQGKIPAQDSIVESELKTLKMLPATFDLFRMETESRSIPQSEKMLKNLLEEIRRHFDYIVIDSPPAINLLTVNGLSAADAILIPMQCEFYALEGMPAFLHAVGTIKKFVNPNLRIDGILLTMVDMMENFSRRIYHEVRRNFKTRIFQTVIPRSPHLRAAPVFRKPLLLRDVRSRGAQSYLQLAKELMDENYQS